MIKEQLEQINKGFIFNFEGDEVEVTSVKHHICEEHSEVRITKTENYNIVGSFKKEFIAQYLEKTGQEDLLNLELISAGRNLIDDLGLKKIKIGVNKGLYNYGKPMTLLEVGKLAFLSVYKKDINTWFNTLNVLKNGE